MKHNALIHDDSDDVAVVIVDISAGETVSTVDLEGNSHEAVKAIDDIPLGHKIALRDMPSDHRVMKYGRSIGKTSTTIGIGSHVHVHNIKSERWA